MKKNILLIEDDSFITQMYATKINDIGFNVQTVSTEGEAKEALLSQKGLFDLVLLDLILPDVSGFDILAWLKSEDDLRAIPVIILSNLSSQADVNQAFEMGVVDYIVKSNYTPSEVMRTIQKHLIN